MSLYPGWRDFDPAKRAIALKAPKRHKYGAQVHSVLPGLEVVSGDMPGALKFSSKREANRYVQLKRDPAITHLRLQPRFPLHVTTPQGTTVCIGEYIADFAYRTNGVEVTEDAKGMRTETYRWKRRHVEIEYGIRIQEV